MEINDSDKHKCLLRSINFKGVLGTLWKTTLQGMKFVIGALRNKAVGPPKMKVDLEVGSTVPEVKGAGSS